MADELTVVEAPPTTDDQRPTTPAPEKKQYRYQPTYPEGHELAGQPMGGEQVVEYDGTPEDLAAQLVANNNRMQAEMRRLAQRATVEVQSDEEALPSGALTRKRESFARRDFTPEEKLRFAKGLMNPQTIQETFDEMTAARVGSNEEFKHMTALQIQTAESNAGFRFGREHPELLEGANDTPYTTPGGAKTMVPRGVALLLTWCDKRDLYHTYDNLVLAWDRLKKAGLLSEAPIAARKTVQQSPAPATQETAADSVEPPAQPARRPVATRSALRPGDGRGNPPPATRGPSWQDIESLSAEQLRGKPADWKRQAVLLFRKLPNQEMIKKLDQRGMSQKFEALSS